MEEKYYHTKESVDEYINLSLDVSGMELIDKLKEMLPPGSSLLEIGSGPGTDWRILSDSYSVLGSDNSAEFLDHLIKENPEGEFLELDARTLKTDKKFNGIYTNKVLHHLSDKELYDSVKRQYEILLPDGIICHSFWKGEGSEVFKGLFVNYHSKGGLGEVFKNYFEILSIEYYNEFDKDDSILLLGRKK